MNAGIFHGIAEGSQFAALAKSWSNCGYIASIIVVGLYTVGVVTDRGRSVANVVDG